MDVLKVQGKCKMKGLYGLWSFQDMQKIYAKPLLDMQDLLVQWSIVGRTSSAKYLIADKNKEEFLGYLDKLISELQLPEFKLCKKAAQRLSDNIKAGVSRSQLLQNIEDLRGRILDQLDLVWFLALSTDEKDLFEPPQPVFGNQFARKFPSALFDLDEGSKCLAIGRHTACVFHLMRIMEIGIQQLGKKLSIDIDPAHETWHQILLHVNKAINAMPVKTASQKSKKAKYATSSAHLSNVRIAWRNEVMHPKAIYTEEEAKEIFSHTRTFMRNLADFI